MWCRLKRKLNFVYENFVKWDKRKARKYIKQKMCETVDHLSICESGVTSSVIKNN